MAVVLMSLLVGVVVLVVTYTILRIRRFIRWHRETVKILSHFPGPKPHWFFGNVLEMGCFSDFLMKMHKEFVEEKHAKGFVFWQFLILPILHLTHPDTIKVLMKSHAPKDKAGAGCLLMLPWIGDSVLITDGPKWERMRKLLSPAFHFKILNGHFKVFNDVSDTLLETFSIRCKKGKYIEVYNAMGLVALDTLLRCTLSYEGNVQSAGDNHPYVKAVKRMIHLMMARAFNILMYPEQIYRMSSGGKEFFRLCDFVHNFSEEIIAKRRKELIQQTDVQGKKYLDFLDILLTAKDEENQGLTDKEIRNEVDTFMFAGHDTTASALSWTIYCLGKYKDVQERVYTEINEVVGDRHYLDGEDIAKMSFLTCVVKETLRLYTTAPAISRMLDHSKVIDGVELPTGTIIYLNLYSLHHNPDVWTDPWEFKPERFEGNKHHDMDHFSFVPFSAGPRNCIGQAFAMNEMKVVIARIVKRFEISLDPDHVPEPFIEVVLRAKNGIMVNFKDRLN